MSTAKKPISISLLNMKGGVGKTSLAVNLAYAFAARQNAWRRVLLVDLDPQFNASQWLLKPDEWDVHRKKNGTVADILIEPSKATMTVKSGKRTAVSRIEKVTMTIGNFGTGGRLDLIPSELELSRAIKAPAEVPYKLEKALIEVSHKYDYVLIDCAPTDSILTDTALMASDFVLVPMRPDKFSVLGYAQIGEAIANFKDKFPDPHAVKDLGVVFTMVGGNNTLEAQCMKEVREQASYVYDAQIRFSRTFAKAVSERAPVFWTTYARDDVKTNLLELLDEVEGRIGNLSSGK